MGAGIVTLSVRTNDSLSAIFEYGSQKCLLNFVHQGKAQNLSVFKNSCFLTLLWKLGALSGNGLNNATQFSLSFSRKDIVIPAVNSAVV
jgi:hypothetical protein